jgi:hypothetical protein
MIKKETCGSMRIVRHIECDLAHRNIGRDTHDESVAVQCLETLGISNDGNIEVLGKVNRVRRPISWVLSLDCGCSAALFGCEDISRSVHAARCCTYEWRSSLGCDNWEIGRPSPKHMI